MRYSGTSSEVFSWTAQAGHDAVTSTVTMTEILVHPYRKFGENGARDYYSLLVSYPTWPGFPPICGSPISRPDFAPIIECVRPTPFRRLPRQFSGLPDS